MTPNRRATTPTMATLLRISRAITTFSSFVLRNQRT